MSRTRLFLFLYAQASELPWIGFSWIFKRGGSSFNLRPERLHAESSFVHLWMGILVSEWVRETKRSAGFCSALTPPRFDRGLLRTFRRRWLDAEASLLIALAFNFFFVYVIQH